MLCLQGISIISIMEMMPDCICVEFPNDEGIPVEVGYVKWIIEPALLESTELVGKEVKIKWPSCNVLEPGKMLKKELSTSAKKSTTWSTHNAVVLAVGSRSCSILHT